jgi:uncharacterized YccA/Bax inhibitor family protein
LVCRRTSSGDRRPNQPEWYAAFRLMVTIIWLYMEILRLVGKTRS